MVDGQRGYDAGKSVKGRKRQLIVDTLGFLLALVVHRADINERKGAIFVLARLNKSRADYPFLKVIFADAGYCCGFETTVKNTSGWILRIIRRPFGVKGVRIVAQTVDSRKDFRLVDKPTKAKC
ncbi:MAG: putative transposase [Spirosomataceae bacterium]